MEPPALSPVYWRGGDDLLRCTAIATEAAGVKTFRFASVSGARIAFHPGQFVTLRLPLPAGEAWRCFTIASSPAQEDAIDLTIKTQGTAETINTSGTAWMHHALAVGMTLKAMPPAGPFCLMHPPETPLLLVSAGSGATPMASIARWLRDIGCRTPVHYVHLARTPADWLFKPEIEAIAAELGSWRLDFLTTTETGRPAAAGFAAMAPDLATREVFCCGPAGFMAAVEAAHADAGGPTTAFRKEAFIAIPIPELAPKPPNPAAATLTFTVRFEPACKGGRGQALRNAAGGRGTARHRHPLCLRGRHLRHLPPAETLRHRRDEPPGRHRGGGNRRWRNPRLLQLRPLTPGFGTHLMAQHPSEERSLALETLAVSAGYDPAEHGGAAKPPIYMTSTFVYASAAQARAVHQAFFDGDVPERGGKNGYIYARLDHPNLVMAQTRIAALDRAEDSALFASGMAAVSTLAMTFLRPGDSVMHSRPIYGGTDMLLHSHMAEMGVNVFGFTDGVDEAAMAAVADAAMAKGPLTLIMVESPANPTCAIADLAMISRLADRIALAQGRRPIISVDNTFLGPFLQSPLEHGADLCLTSLTKYAGGHSDFMAGSA